MSSPVVVLLKRRPKRLPLIPAAKRNHHGSECYLQRSGIGRRHVRLPVHWLRRSTISQAERTHHLKSTVWDHLLDAQVPLPSRENASSQKHCLEPPAGRLSPRSAPCYSLQRKNPPPGGQLLAFYIRIEASVFLVCSLGASRGAVCFHEAASEVQGFTTFW